MSQKNKGQTMAQILNFCGSSALWFRRLTWNLRINSLQTFGACKEKGCTCDGCSSVARKRGARATFSKYWDFQYSQRETCVQMNLHISPLTVSRCSDKFYTPGDCVHTRYSVEIANYGRSASPYRLLSNAGVSCLNTYFMLRHMHFRQNNEKGWSKCIKIS